MHSKKFHHRVLVITFAALIAIPSGAFADGPVGKDAISQRAAELKAEIKTLQGVISKIRADKTYTDEDVRESDIQAVQTKIDADQIEMNKYNREVKAADRKFRKTVRDESTVAEQQKLVDDANAKLKDVSKLSIDEIAALRQQRDDAQAEIVRLQKRVVRKEEGYKKKVGEAMPVRCTLPQVRDAETNTCRSCTVVEVLDSDAHACRPKVCKTDEEMDTNTGNCETKCKEKEARDPTTRVCRSTVKDPTVEQKRGVAACWDETHVTTKDVYSLFRKGDSDIATKPDPNADTPSYDYQKPLTAFFEKQVGALGAAIKPNGRISAVNVRSYSSNVKYSKDKTKSDVQLAASRSAASLKNFYPQLFASGGIAKEWARPVDLPYAENMNDAKVKGKFNGGPSWQPGEYDRLAKLAVTEKEVRAAAEAIMKNSDPTPVKGKTVEETMANLDQCCAANQAVLKYQPYQFTRITVSMPTFTPDAPACVTDATKVANATGAKTVPATGVGQQGTGNKTAGCVPDEDNNCAGDAH